MMNRVLSTHNPLMAPDYKAPDILPIFGNLYTPPTVIQKPTTDSHLPTDATATLVNTIQRYLKEEAVAEQAQRAGKSPKGDALNKFMTDVFTTSPSASFEDLCNALRRELEAGGIVTNIDEEEIEFDNGTNGSSKMETVSIGALRHRFYRMRKLHKPDSATGVK